MLQQNRCNWKQLTQLTQVTQQMQKSYAGAYPRPQNNWKRWKLHAFFFINVSFLEFEIELFFSTEEKSIWTLTKIILKKTVKIVSDGTLKLYSVLFLTHFVEMEVCRKLCSACVSNILFLSHMFTSNIHPLIVPNLAFHNWAMPPQWLANAHCTM